MWAAVFLCRWVKKHVALGRFWDFSPIGQPDDIQPFWRCRKS
jgi:hypothetical protein